MRYLPLLALSLALAACDNFPSSPHPVDASHLPPLSGQEQALLISADTSAATGDFDSAERNYLTAIGKSQGHVEAHLALANLYLRQNQPDKAKEILDKAALFQPNHPEVNHLLGKIALEKSHGQEALAAYERGLVTAPNDLDLLTGSGIAHDMLHDHRSAQVAYLKAIGLHQGEDLASVKTNLAMSYLLSNQARKVIPLLKDDVKKPDASPVMRDNLALAYGMMGRHVEARALLKGSMSEDDRLASLGRLKQYIADEENPPPPAASGSRPAVVAPTPPVHPAAK